MQASPIAGGPLGWSKFCTSRSTIIHRGDCADRGDLDNPVVSYTPVACPGALTQDYRQCTDCAGRSRVRRGSGSN